MSASSQSRSVSSKKASHQVPVQILEGHENWVNCVCFCPDEDKLVTGSSDNTLRIWNRTTGAVEMLRGHTDWLWDVDVSRDGKMIVSGSDDKTVQIWNGELEGETMHVCEGHEDWVRSVQFSPDLSRVVSGSDDKTVRVWSVETGELAFEPIKCHGWVCCVHYSPSGDRIASGADSVQIWNAETGSGIVSIRDSEVISLAWTADGTHLIGGRQGEVTIWNSHTGEQLRTWTAHDDKWVRLSLSPAGNHLATSAWNDNTVFVFDVSTGEQIAVLKHDKIVEGIAYSPSGKLIATGCRDDKVYLWEAPAVEDPPAKSSARPFSSFLDRPAIPLAGPSRNNRREFDAFWDTLPNRNQQAPPQREPQRVFDKVRNTFTNIFTRRPAGATQAIPQGPVRETVEPVEVAAGRDNIFWVVILIPTYNAVEKFLYTLIHCRKPEDPDEEVPATTGANSSQTAADNAAASSQSGHPETGDGPENAPTLAGNFVIRTQPQHTAAMRLSGKSTNAEPYPSETPVGDSQVYNQPESIEMVATPETSTVSAHASPQPTPSTGPLSSTTVTSYQLPTSTANLATAPLVVSSPEERAFVEEYRRLKNQSLVVRMVTAPLSSPAHDHDSYIYHGSSMSPSQSPGHITPSTSSTASPISSQARSHIRVQPSQPSAGLDPLLSVVPSLLSPSPLSAPLRHSLHPRPTATVQSLGLHLMAPSDNPRAEAPSESATQLTLRGAASDDEVD